jgi:hypothetical protein
MATTLSIILISIILLVLIFCVAMLFALLDDLEKKIETLYRELHLLHLWK